MWSDRLAKIGGRCFTTSILLLSTACLVMSGWAVRSFFTGDVIHIERHAYEGVFADRHDRLSISSGSGGVTVLVDRFYEWGDDASLQAQGRLESGYIYDDRFRLMDAYTLPNVYGGNEYRGARPLGLGFAFNFHRGDYRPDQVYCIVAMPWIVPIALTATIPLLGLRRFLRRHRLERRRRSGLCIACGYDVRGLKERCPECGTSVLSR